MGSKDLHVRNQAGGAIEERGRVDGRVHKVLQCHITTS